MGRSRLLSARRAAVARRGRLAWPIAVAVSLLLSAWCVAYELADTLLPGWSDAPAFAGVAHDAVFALAGLLLIARGFGGERGWVLIGAGALCWAAGDVYWWVALSSLSTPPVPSWADAGYLLFCPLAFAGILTLVRQRVSGAPRTLVADALAAALAAGALSAAVVLHPVLSNASGESLEVATNLAYPVSDLLLLGLIVGATALGSWRLSRTWMLLGASILAFWIADSLYLITVATNTYQQNGWFNPLWYWSPVLAAWAAWLPRGACAQTRQPTTSRRGIVMPLAFTITAVAVLVWSSFDPVGVPAIVLATGSLLAGAWRLALTWRDNARLLQATKDQAMIDELTGLANRRALTAELEDRLSRSSSEHPFTLVLFDLDGFKRYNDNFGHPAGDALLQRLGAKLASHLQGIGTAYRMGGDEFCALIGVPLSAPGPAVREAAAALSEHGEGFTIGCSYGSVMLPTEADDSPSALRIADQRMYAHKRRGSAVAPKVRNLLLRALTDTAADIGSRSREVAVLASATAELFSLPADQVEQTRQAAELHNVGKVAIPDAILDKPAPLDQHEWDFIHRHPLIGERIIAAATELREVATLVRSTHEHYDGTGYPDALTREEIPLGARIIAVCDAYDAMTSDRPYRQAMSPQAAIAELHRGAGTQFDPAIVEQFCKALRSQRIAVARAA